MRRGRPVVIGQDPKQISQTERAGQTDVTELDQIRDRGLQTYWLVQLASARAALDPAAAANWLRDLPGTLDRQEAFAQVERLWAERQPEAAANFALALPPGRERQAALAAAISVWLVQSPAAASAWSNELDGEPDFDGVVALISNFSPLVQKRPDVALGWAEGITNREERRQRIATIVGAWAATDRVAALHYLRTSSVLSEFERDTLMESFDGNL